MSGENSKNSSKSTIAVNLSSCPIGCIIPGYKCAGCGAREYRGSVEVPKEVVEQGKEYNFLRKLGINLVSSAGCSRKI